MERVPAPVDAWLAGRLEELLKELGRREVVQELYTDVDYTKWGVNPANIKQPMDLRTVKEHLARDRTLSYSEKRYKCVAHFAHDVRVVFKNGFLLTRVRDYDKSGKKDLGANKTFKATEEACKRFEDSLAALEAELDQRGPAVPLSGRCQLLLSDLRHNPLSEWFRRDDWRDIGQEYVDVLAAHRCSPPLPSSTWQVYPPAHHCRPSRRTPSPSTTPSNLPTPRVRPRRGPAGTTAVHVALTRRPSTWQFGADRPRQRAAQAHRRDRVRPARRGRGFRQKIRRRRQPRLVERDQVQRHEHVDRNGREDARKGFQGAYRRAAQRADARAPRACCTRPRRLSTWR